jgi:hypothetical protein
VAFVIENLLLMLTLLQFKHASRCFLNPDAQKASAAIHRAVVDKESEGRNSSSKRLRSSLENFTFEAPICECNAITDY